MGHPQTAEDRMGRAIRAALEAVTDSPHANRLLSASLELEGRPSIPADRDAARRFVTGSLRHVVLRELGLAAYGVVAERLGPVFLEPVHQAAMETRHPAIPPPAGFDRRSGTYRKPPATGAVRRIIAVSLDAHSVERVQAQLTGNEVLTRASLLSDLRRLAADGPSVVWVDALLPSIALGALAAVTEGPLRNVEVFVTDITAAGHERLARTYPAARRWHRVALEELPVRARQTA